MRRTINFAILGTVIALLFAAGAVADAASDINHQTARLTAHDDDDHRGIWFQCGGPSRGLNLQILHSSDNESSFQDPNTLEPKILHYATVVAGLKRYATRKGFASIHLTAGDHTLPGPFYQAAAEVPGLGAEGLGDIKIYNAMDLSVNGMGNHEFDGNLDEFATMLRAANYPFVAVNLDFSNAMTSPHVPQIRIGQDLAPAIRNRGKVVHSTVLNVRGECIGVVGRAPADFFNIIEDPDVNLPGLDFVGGRDENNQPLVSAVGQVLEEVDALKQQGINKIILLDHAQDFTGDPLSAQSLRDIDIIVAAGSTGFMAKSSPDGPFNLLRPGDTPGADYPTVRSDMDGKPILVVNSDQLYRYVGNLMVKFDRQGNITEVRNESGPVATTEEAIDLLRTRLRIRYLPTPHKVKRVFEQLQQTPLIQNLFEEIGITAFPLNGLRADVRSRETNLGQLAADSTLVYSQDNFPGLGVDASLKNGGGIRDSILGPNIIRLTIQAALAFDNDLAILELTGDQLIAAMENAVSRVPALDGRFPQVAGMFLEYDASLPGLEGEASVTVPSRVKTLRIFRSDGTLDALVEGGMAQGDLSRTFVISTNSFLRTGGDGYAAFAAGVLLDQTVIGEQQILEEYIVSNLGGTVNIQDPPMSSRVVRLDIP